MTSIAKPLFAPFLLVQLRLPRLFSGDRRRRRTTMDLLHSSPHLLRDIGLSEGPIGSRRR